MFIMLDTFSGIRYGEWLTQIVRPNLPLGVAKVTHRRCSSEVNLEQLAKAKKQGILKLSPVDEVEGEIIYFQNRLLGNAVARKHFTGPFLFPFIFCFFGYAGSLLFTPPYPPSQVLHYSNTPSKFSFIEKSSFKSIYICMTFFLVNCACR